MLAGGFSTARSMGLGLSGSKRLVNEFTLETGGRARHVHDGDEVDTFLVEEWLEGVPSTPVLDGASVAIVRDLVRQRAGEIGMPGGSRGPPRQRGERARAEPARARPERRDRGRAIQRGAVRGLEVRAVDSGRGLRRSGAAFRGGASTAGTLGHGLAAVAELGDELDVDTRRGEGTCIRVRVFAARITRVREVGVIGRPIEGEDLNGDDALVRRIGDALVAIVIDGLGHGVEAREAALVVKRVAHKRHRGEARGDPRRLPRRGGAERAAS